MCIRDRFAEEDKKRREEVETKNNAENLCYQAEKLVNESGDKLEEADKTEVMIQAPLAHVRTLRPRNGRFP